jgi:hypothetical protein
MAYYYTVEINDDGDYPPSVNVKSKGAYPEPFGQAMCDEICTAIDSALQGDYLGGWNLGDDGWKSGGWDAA